MHIVNPEKCTQTEACKYFRDNTPVVYAKGFTNFQKKMTQEQYQKFLDILQKSSAATRILSVATAKPC